MFLKILQGLIDLLRSDNMKVQVIMEEDFVKRLDALARANGLSRSGYINMVMVRHVTAEEVRQQGFDKLLEKNEKE